MQSTEDKKVDLLNFGQLQNKRTFTSLNC